MFKMFKIAFFNLWRRKSRSFMVILMVGVGLSAMIFSQGFYDGMLGQMFKDIVRTGEGEISITGDGYRESKLLKDVLPNSDYKKVLSKVENVRFVSERLRSEGMASSARFSQGVILVGSTKEAEKDFIGYNNPIIEGEFSFPEDKKIVSVGHVLAEKLKVKIGRKIVLQAQDATGQIVASVFRVGGIFTTNNPALDKRGVMININLLRDFLKKDAVSEIAIVVKDIALLDKTNIAVKDLWEKEYGDKADIKTFIEIYPMLISMEKSINVFIYISYFAICLAIAMGIFNIMTITVYERMKEYGILQAVGTPMRKISAMVYFEAVALCGLGYLMAALFGSGLLSYFTINGLDLSRFSEGLNDMGMASVIFAEFHVSYLITALVAIMITAVISVYIPVRKLKKMRPMQSIRFS